MITRKRAYEILEISEGDPVSRGFDIFIITLIVLNIFALVLKTVDPIHQMNPSLFQTFELVSVTIFSVEYVLRVWCSAENPDSDGPIKSRIRYLFSFYGLIDLMAILPFFLPFIAGDYRFLRAVRLFRLFRVLKLARYTFALSGLKKVLNRKKEELICVGFLLILLLVIASSFMFFLEHEVQPKAYASIPATMWWGIVTLTTVGYGDVYPITFMGKILAAVIAILGIGLFALPAGLIGGAFLEEMEERKNQKQGKSSASQNQIENTTDYTSKHLALDIWLNELPGEAHAQIVRNFFETNFSGFRELELVESNKKVLISLASANHSVVLSAPDNKDNLVFLDWTTQDKDYDFESSKEELLNQLSIKKFSSNVLLRGTKTSDN